MSGPAQAPETPIAEKSALIAYIAAGAKPNPADWRIGVEHEKFGFRLHDLSPLPYEGPSGIRAMLTELERFGWQPITEGDKLIALSLDGQSVTLEPGGQLELSGAPRQTLHQTCHEVNTHLAQVKLVGQELGAGFVGLGFQPKWRREQIPIMPKGRYDIMRAYMPKRGDLGLDMMLRTCTVQVNLDFGSEADMVRKFRVGLALQPVVTALFANSPFTEGKPNGYLSFRSAVWEDTDPDRTGMLPFVFEEDFCYERYVDWALDVPMYFVYRNGRYIDVSGQSFRAFLDGRLPALPGERPTMRDFADHLTTLFPEVRLKRFLEMRGADGGPWRRLCALPALWVGLVYDAAALDAAYELTRDWTAAEREGLRRAVPRAGLKTAFRNRTVLEIAEEVVEIASGGLKRRRRLNAEGSDESHFLNPLREILSSGRTPAEALLDLYNGKWNRNIDPIFTELAY